MQRIVTGTSLGDDSLHDHGPESGDGPWDVDVRDLATSMDAGIGAPSNRELRGRIESQDDAESRLQLALNGALSRLFGPPGETSTIVTEIQPDTNEPDTSLSGSAGLV